MSETVSQRELRNDNAALVRRVEQGESFTVTRHGRPVADLVPHVPSEVRRRTWGEVAQRWASLPPIDGDRWRVERDQADQVFGSDELDDP